MRNILLSNNYFNSIDSILVENILNEAPIRRDLILLNYDWTKYIKRYFLLTYGADKIPYLSIDLLYTNRYYLLEKFYHYYKIYIGEDAGIEQQIGLIIEEMCNHLKNYDWIMLEKISNEIKNGTA